MLIYDIQNLIKTYPGQSKPVNDRITLQIHQSEIFGILGDNGASKSTLVRQMVNLLPSDAGIITFLGKNITTIPQIVQMNVGYMPQESGAVNSLTIAEALYFTLDYYATLPIKRSLSNFIDNNDRPNQRAYRLSLVAQNRNFCIKIIGNFRFG